MIVGADPTKKGIGQRGRISRELSLDRLAEYLRVLLAVQSEEFAVTDILKSVEVTHRDLTADLELLGLPRTETVLRSQLVRLLQRRMAKERLTSQVARILDPDVPTAESLLDQLAPGNDAPERARAVESAFELALGEPGLFLLGHGLLRRGHIAYKHQIDEALRIVELFLGNVIMVHEVGLGKTLTAILVLCELLLRDPNLSTLILVPTNLCLQWHEEFQKCEVPVASGYTLRDGVLAYVGLTLKQITATQHVLLPIDGAKQSKWANALLRRRWDLLIVDEGHLLRHDHTARYRFLYSLRSRFRLLLTATPVHNSPYDILHQVNVVRPGLLGRKAIFAESYVVGERQLGNAQLLQERLTAVVTRKRRQETGLRFARRDIIDIPVGDRSAQERLLYDDILTILRGIYRRHLGPATLIRGPSGKELRRSQIVLVSILVLRELASHPLSALKTLQGPLVRSVERLAAVTEDSTDLAQLHGIIERHADVQWGNIGAHSKTDALLKQLPELIQQHGRVIVYVEFRETQKVIVERLMKKREAGLPAATAVIAYKGDLPRTEKDHQIERYAGHPFACLVSTEAGGQGLNLQAGNVIVNFDFPWNPMRIEQRIGRVDRLRQGADVVIIRNFMTVDTIEQYVYQTLRQKLKVCEDVLGHVLPQIFRLSGVDERYRTDEDVLGIGQLILSSLDDRDLAQKFLALGREIDEQVSSRPAGWRPERSRRWSE